VRKNAYDEKAGFEKAGI